MWRDLDVAITLEYSLHDWRDHNNLVLTSLVLSLLLASLDTSPNTLDWMLHFQLSIGYLIHSLYLIMQQEKSHIHGKTINHFNYFFFAAIYAAI